MEAKEKVKTEMTRLLQDPITGEINKDKLINAKKRIATNHLVESEEYKIAEKKLTKKKKFHKKFLIASPTNAG